MPQINVDKEPGWYGGAIDVTVTFGADSRKAIITEDDRIPVLSEVLAYDRGPLASGLPNPATPNAPGYVDRPFLAVTQDGRGNVFYDGGFPKFYNTNIKIKNGGSWPAQLPTTFAGLDAAAKYLHNALRFISNKTKVNAGNNKILFVGNGVITSEYPLKGSYYDQLPGQKGPENGFRDTFNCVSSIAGYAPTYYSADDAPNNKIDLTFEYLDQFAAVIFLGSGNSNPSSTYVTPRFSSELAYYRSLGNGVGIITDHNNAFYTDAVTAAANSGVFCYDPNQLAKNFGTFFSGDVDRNPVSVGAIRAALGGDHPLLANLGDNESIFAGGSESLVMVETFAANQVPVDQPKVFNLTTAGTHRINVLVQDNNGQVAVKPYRYDLIDPSSLFLLDQRARVVGQTYSSIKKSFDMILSYNIPNPPSMSGYVFRNAVRMGTFSMVNNAITIKYCSGNSGGFEFLPTDKVGFSIQFPFLYRVETVVQNVDRTQLVANWTQPAVLGKLLAATPDYTGMKTTEALRAFWQYCNAQYRDRFTGPGNVFGIWPRVLSRCKRGLSGPLGMCNLWVATNPADWTANKPANPAEGDSVIIATTNDVYTWWITNGTGAWELRSEKANALFGLARGVNNTRDNTIWIIQIFTTVKA